MGDRPGRWVEGGNGGMGGIRGGWGWVSGGDGKRFQGERDGTEVRVATRSRPSAGQGATCHRQGEQPMPWEETCPMDERVKFIAAYLRGEENVTSLCATFGVSRKAHQTA